MALKGFLSGLSQPFLLWVSINATHVSWMAFSKPRLSKSGQSAHPRLTSQARPGSTAGPRSHLYLLYMVERVKHAFHIVVVSDGMC